MLRRAYWMWVLLGVVIFSGSLQGDALVLPERELSGVSTLKHTEYLRQSGDVQGVKMLQEEGLNFLPLKSDVLAVTDGHAAYYLRFRLINQGLSPRKLYLELAHPHLEELVLYTPDVSGIRISRSGGGLPYGFRQSQYRNYAFPITASPGENLYYLKIKSRGLLRAPLKLWDQAPFERLQFRELLWNGLYYGILFVMSIHFLMIYLMLRDRVSMYRALFTLTMLVGLALNDGYGQSLYPDWGYWTTQVAALCFPLINIFVLRFIRAGESTARRISRLDRAIEFMTIILCAHVVSFFILPYKLFVETLMYLMVPVSITTPVDFYSDGRKYIALQANRLWNIDFMRDFIALTRFFNAL